MYRNLLNIALFNLGWFACVAGGDKWALAAVPAILLIHWRYLVVNNMEWVNIALAAAIGISIDSAWQMLGILQFNSSFFGVPLWLFLLWFLFPTTLNHSLAWLQNRLVLASALGAIFGPLSYVAGIALGAATSPAGLPVLVLCLSICWAVLTPGLLVLMRENTGKVKSYAGPGHRT